MLGLLSERPTVGRKKKQFVEVRVGGQDRMGLGQQHSDSGWKKFLSSSRGGRDGV